jgi:ankyrin repeat protein
MGNGIKELKVSADVRHVYYKEGHSGRVLYACLMLITAVILAPVWVAAENDQGQALAAAAMEGKVEQLKELLAQGVDANSRNPAGRSALHLAAFNGNEMTVLTLLSAGADVNLVDGKGGTALMDAAAFGHLDVVEVLIQAGVDVNVKDKAGNTAMDYANKGGFTPIIKRLSDAGAVETPAN